MAEIDAFERRVAGTLQWYADEVEPTVDASAVAHRAALEHPRRPAGAGFGAWRLAAVPQAGWVLLLGATLLAALAGGLLVVGSQRQTRPPAVVPPALATFECPPGTDPDAPGPGDLARPALGGSLHTAFDRRAGKVVVLAVPGDAGTAETWTFDVCTNRWTPMQPVQEPDEAGRLVYDADSDLIVMLAESRVWAYDVDANTWIAKSATPSSLQHITYSLAYDTTTGLVVVEASTSDRDTDPSELWTYDVEADPGSWTVAPAAAWTRIAQRGAIPDVGRATLSLLVHDPSVDRLVSLFLEGGPQTQVRLFDFGTTTWSTSVSVAPDVSIGWGPEGYEAAFDEVTGRSVVIDGGRVVAFDASKDEWEILADTASAPASPYGPSGPPGPQGPSVVYDSANRRLVVCGGRYYRTGSIKSDWVRTDDVWAFDTRTRTWTQLLARSGP